MNYCKIGTCNTVQHALENVEMEDTEVPHEEQLL